MTYNAWYKVDRVLLELRDRQTASGDGSGSLQSGMYDES